MLCQIRTGGRTWGGSGSSAGVVDGPNVAAIVGGDGSLGDATGGRWAPMGAALNINISSPAARMHSPLVSRRPTTAAWEE